MKKLPWTTEEEFYDLHAEKMFKKDSFYHVGVLGKDEEEDADYLIRKLGIKSNDKVVDLGCGSGFLVHKMGKICKSIGISSSKECIKFAKINYPNDCFIQAKMEDFSEEGITHFISVESIGYSNVFKTLKNAFDTLVDGGIFFIKDTSLISNPTKKEVENIDYWSNYWKCYSLNVEDMIVTASKVGFQLVYFKDINQEANLNLKPFMETLKDNLIPQEYPHPNIPVHTLTEFIFRKKKREEWINPFI